MAVITLSRQYGSGGDEIAVKVCELLGYQYFDKRSIVRVAAEIGLTEQDVVDFSEDQHKMQSFLDRVLRRPRPAPRAQNSPGGKANAAVLTEETALSLVRSAIRAAYHEDNIVIVGRGGQVVLRGRPGVLHVRIEAPLERRVARIQKRERTDGVSAEERVLERDAVTADYLKRFYEVN